MHTHDEGWKGIGTYVLACFVAGITGIFVGFGSDIVWNWGIEPKHVGSTVLWMMFIAGVAGVVTLLLAALPTLAFLWVAQRRGCRDPGTYLLFGCGLATLFCLPFLGPSPAKGGALLGIGFIVGGGLAGLIYWRIAVRPLRRTVPSPKSGR